MAACSKYRHRLKKALEFRGLKYPQEIIDYMGKRATTDRSLDGIIIAVCDIVEPPNCTKSHCPHFTTFSFCNCIDNRVPGKCPLNLEYLKKKKEREEKKYQERVAQLPENFFPLSKENEEKIRTMDDNTWQKAIKKYKKQRIEKKIAE